MNRLLPLLILLAAPLASAQTTPAPRLEVSPAALDFPDGGGTLELRLTNKGNADLVINGFQVIEEGFDKKAEDLKKQGPVFKLDRAESETFVIAPGSAAVAVKVEYRPTGRQK